MSDPNTQLEYACLYLFPSDPMSIIDLEGHLSNSDFDYVLYSQPDRIMEFIIVNGTESYQLEYRQGIGWLGPHNAGSTWREHPRYDTAAEVADKWARLGWSVRRLPGSSEGKNEDGAAGV